MTIKIAKWAMAAVLSSLALAPARADVARNYQTVTFTYTLTYRSEVVHTDTVKYSPCDNSLSGSGVVTFLGRSLSETIHGSLLTSPSGFPAGLIAIKGDAFLPITPLIPYIFTGTVDSSGKALGTVGTFLGHPEPATLQIDMKSVVVTTWKTHGDYVAFSGETASDAAHSCIGMPVPSNN